MSLQVRERLRVALERCSLLEEELGATHKEVSSSSVWSLSSASREDRVLLFVRWPQASRVIVRWCSRGAGSLECPCPAAVGMRGPGLLYMFRSLWLCCAEAVWVCNLLGGILVSYSVFWL